MPDHKKCKGQHSHCIVENEKQVPQTTSVKYYTYAMVNSTIQVSSSLPSVR